MQTDVIFNINKLRLLFLTCISVTNTGQTFSFHYSFITSESTEAFTHMWRCMYDFIWYDAKTDILCPPPRVIILDQSNDLITSLARREAAQQAAEETARQAGLGTEAVEITGEDAGEELDAVKATVVVADLQEREGAHPIGGVAAEGGAEGGEAEDNTEGGEEWEDKGEEDN